MRFYNFIVLSVILFFIEIVLQFFSLPIDKSNIDFDFNGNLKVDNVGINSYYQNFHYYKLNEQGFRSDIDFNSTSVNRMRSEGKKIAMLVGDSHVEGCCAKPIENSFVDILNSKMKKYHFLNFGIGGMDPLQYKLIIDKYLPIICPDIIIVVFCIQNDFMRFKRIPNKNIPLFYFNENEWISSHLPFSHPQFEPNKYFSSWDELKDYYMFSNKPLAKLLCIQKSKLNFLTYYSFNLFKKSYFYLKNYFTHNESVIFKIRNMNLIYTREYLEQITQLSNNSNTRFILVGMPSIEDYGSNGLFKKSMDYKRIFNKIDISFPKTLFLSDFVGRGNDHLNNNGHIKYAFFLEELIKEHE